MKKRHSRMRTRSRGFRRLGGDRVSPQLPQLLGKKSSDSRCAKKKGGLIEAPKKILASGLMTRRKIVTLADGRSSMSPLR